MYCSLISLLTFSVYYYWLFFSYHSDGWNQQIQFQSCATSNAGSLQYLECCQCCVTSYSICKTFLQKSVIENLFFLKNHYSYRYCSSSSSCSATSGGSSSSRRRRRSRLCSRSRSRSHSPIVIVVVVVVGVGVGVVVVVVVVVVTVINSTSSNN